MRYRIQPLEIEIPEDDPFKNDLLGRRKSVEVLTNLAGSIKGPCVLTVDGGWGTGKTTFLRIWSQYLRNDDFPVVEFNAWETDFAGEPFVALSTELTEGLEKYVDSGDQALQRYIACGKHLAKTVILRSLPTLVRLTTLGALPPVIEKQLDEAIASYESDQSSGYQQERAAVKEFRDALKEVVQASSSPPTARPLVVVIDELDRCRPSYAVELLEAAKHIFAVSGILFVLGVNRSELAHSIKAVYGGEFDAHGYLRRFVDLDFRLPNPERTQFIDATLNAIRIDDYFDRTKDENVRWNDEAQVVRDWLQKFFGASNLDLRRIGQAIHHLGLVFASLRSDRRSFAMTAVVILIVRTIVPELYLRFTRGEATDLQVVDSIFEHNVGLQSLQHEYVGHLFEVMIIVAAHELSRTRDGSIDSPLLDRYKKLLDEESSDPEAKKHAKLVAVRFQEMQNVGTVGHFGVLESVERLELLSHALVGQQE